MKSFRVYLRGVPSDTPQRPDWWERHPYLRFVFLLLWSAAAYWGSISDIHQGSFYWGLGAHKELVMQSQRPVFFWVTNSIGLAVATLVLCYNVNSLMKYLRNKE